MIKGFYDFLKIHVKNRHWGPIRSGLEPVPQICALHMILLYKKYRFFIIFSSSFQTTNHLLTKFAQNMYLGQNISTGNYFVECWKSTHILDNTLQKSVMFFLNKLHNDFFFNPCQKYVYWNWKAWSRRLWVSWASGFQRMACSLLKTKRHQCFYLFF